MFFDKESYGAIYETVLMELSKNMDDDERQEHADELFANHNKRHSEDPEADAKLNFASTKKVIDKRNQLDPESEQFVRYTAREEGRPVEDVRKEAQRFLKGNSPKKKISLQASDVKLTEDEIKWAKDLGLSEETARETLADNKNTDIPNIRGPL